MSRVPSLPLAMLAGEQLRMRALVDSDWLWDDDDLAQARGTWWLFRPGQPSVPLT